MVLRVTLVARLRISTAAFAIGKADGSLTVPTTVPSSNCANAAAETTSATATREIARFNISDTFLLISLILSLGYSIAGAVWTDLGRFPVSARKNLIRYPRQGRH